MKNFSIIDAIAYFLLNIRLAFSGYFGGLDSLVNSRSDYHNVHSILLKWLNRLDSSTGTKKMITAALADSKNIETVHILFNEYQNSSDTMYKFIAANSIYIINKSDKKSLDLAYNSIINEKLDVLFGDPRIPLLQYLANSKDSRINDLLKKIKNDESMNYKIKETAEYLLKNKRTEKNISPANKRRIM